MHRTNRFYLIVHLARAVPPLRIAERPASQHRVVSLDPGARHFQVWYDPRDGAHGELLAAVRPDAQTDDGNEMAVGGAVDELLERRDRLRRRRRANREPPDSPDAWAAWLARQHGRRVDRERARHPAPVSEADKLHRHWLLLRWREQQRRRRDVVRRIGWRLRNWMRHAHYDAIAFLTNPVDGWDVVVPSTVGFSRLVRRENHTIPFASRRRLGAWSHYAFRQRLLSAAKTRGVLVRGWREANEGDIPWLRCTGHRSTARVARAGRAGRRTVGSAGRTSTSARMRAVGCAFTAT